MLGWLIEHFGELETLTMLQISRNNINVVEQNVWSCIYCVGDTS